MLHLVEWILRADIDKFEVVRTWFERSKIGLAFLVMIGALVHALISTAQQIRWDIRHADDPLG